MLERIEFGSFGEYVYYILILFALFIGYLLTRPIINWLVSLKSVRLLSYLLSGFLILVILMFIIITVDQLDHLLIHLFRTFLQCLAGFGVVLILLKIFGGRQKKQRRH